MRSYGLACVVCLAGCATASQPAHPDGGGVRDLGLVFFEGGADACTGTLGKSCMHDADCSCGEVCLPQVTSPGVMVLECTNPFYPGAKGMGGSACTSSSDCVTGQCLGPAGSQFCYDVCTTKADCTPGTRCYPNYVSIMTASCPVQYDSTSSCAPNIGSFAPCARDADCPATEFCAPWPNRTRTAWEFHCLTATGTLAAGAACMSDAQCKSGQCLKTATGTPVGCFGVCASNGDCAGALPTCTTSSEDVQAGVSSSAAPLPYCQ